jgi:hypothetical protein
LQADKIIVGAKLVRGEDECHVGVITRREVRRVELQTWANLNLKERQLKRMGKKQWGPTDSDILTLSVDKNGEEQSGHQRMGELHDGHRERSILTETMGEREHEELLEVRLAGVSTNDLLNWTKSHLQWPLGARRSECHHRRSVAPTSKVDSRVEYLKMSLDLAPPRALIFNRSRD